MSKTERAKGRFLYKKKHKSKVDAPRSARGRPKCIIFNHIHEALEIYIKNTPFPPLATDAKARRKKHGFIPIRKRCADHPSGHLRDLANNFEMYLNNSIEELKAIKANHDLRRYQPPPKAKAPPPGQQPRKK